MRFQLQKLVFRDTIFDALQKWFFPTIIVGSICTIAVFCLHLNSI